MLIRAVITAFCLVLATGTSCASYINNQLNQAWASFRDLTSAEFSAKFTEMSNAGYRMIDVDAYPNGSGLLYSQVWEKNSDRRQWAEFRDMTATQYAAKWTEMRDAGFRPHDIDSYRSGATQLYAGIWVKNTENWHWSSRRDMTGTEYGQYFTEQSSAGRRPVNIEVYATVNGLRYAAIWYQNAGNVAWSQLRDMSQTSYERELKARTAAGFRPIDFESYQSGAAQLYAVIWERNPTGRAFALRSNRTEQEFANYWRQYRDEGYRLVDFERYNTLAGARYAGLWVENDSRFDYDRKGGIDAAIVKYRDDNTLPGISVAVIRDGTMIYRRGFGYATKDTKVAHGETVYSAASVSKVIGGTLAAKLEADQRLRDGSNLVRSLDLSKPTSDYLKKIKVGFFFVSIPSFHTHTVEQLLSHLGCVAYYDTVPPIEDQTTHYATALSGVRSIWGVGLITGCTVGSTREYSSAAFTFVGSVLERATGRALDTLIRTELAEPYGLPSMRVQWETSVLPPNYDRATPYFVDNSAADYADTSWKMLGGGIEINAVDLATFGWKVLDAEITTATVRDDRLWAPVPATCGTSTAGRCRNGLAWDRGFDNFSRRVAQHTGAQLGARSLLRVYRDHGLVIAIMSNRDEHTQDGDVRGLADEIGAIVLTP